MPHLKIELVFSFDIVQKLYYKMLFTTWILMEDTNIQFFFLIPEMEVFIMLVTPLVFLSFRGKKSTLGHGYHILVSIFSGW